MRIAYALAFLVAGVFLAGCDLLGGSDEKKEERKEEATPKSDGSGLTGGIDKAAHEKKLLELRGRLGELERRERELDEKMDRSEAEAAELVRVKKEHAELLDEIEKLAGEAEGPK
ncbi:MAG: hypothetical protein HY720_07365 [Planctomycetes bacterium]|nr:hypothetical protein [Planctomycetota bacterium]